jgi:tRNA G46 methylase TrmB
MGTENDKELWKPSGEYWEPEATTIYDPRFIAHRAQDIRRIKSTMRERPVDNVRAVELGSHRAAFLLGLADEHAPDHVLGVEYRSKYHRMAERRVARSENKDRIHLVDADARLALPILFPPESLDAIYVTFPDPWWKNQHADRRLIDPAFLRIMARRLRPGGRFYLKSDVFDYLYRVRHYVQLSSAFRPLPSERWPDEARWTLTTRERKCRSEAIPYGRGYYERLDDFDTSLPKEPEEWDRDAWDIEIDPEAIIRGAPPADRKSNRKKGGDDA